MFKKKESMKEIESVLNKTFNVPEIKVDLATTHMSPIFNERLKNFVMTDEIVTQPKKEDEKEEWIWVAGFKGTDKDMKCKDFQFELGKKYDMPENEKIELCSKGFHLCLNLEDVFDYYKVGEGHRFFKVNALVRKKDYDDYDNYDSSIPYNLFFGRSNKLVAKSIEFVSEVTDAELIETASVKYPFLKNLNHEHLKVAFEDSPKAGYALYKKDVLVKDGYSEVFATYISKQDNDKFDRAHAVASEDVSMDVKVMCTFLKD